MLRVGGGGGGGGVWIQPPTPNNDNIKIGTGDEAKLLYQYDMS